ncbi:MAG: FmdB family zinc ribbon protein [Acidimicrobiales bacterium]
MPVYEYKCTVCDERFEIEQKFSDDALTSLEGCEIADDAQHRLKKVFSAVGIAFKGEGFYRNDARGKRAKSTSSTDTTDSSSTASSSGDSASSSSTSTSTAAPSSGSTSAPSSNGGSSSSNGGSSSSD